MKTRNGFVSNSSSSSFVIIGSESIKAVNKNYINAFYFRWQKFRVVSYDFEEV